MILYILLKPVLFILLHTPRCVLIALAKFLGLCLWHLSSDRRHVAIVNAKILGAKDAKKTAKKSFIYTFMAYIDIFYAKRINKKIIDKYVEIEGLEIYEALKKEHKEMAFISGHFGAWSLMATLAYQTAGIKLITIGRSTKNFAIDKILDELRTFEGIKYVTHRGAMEKLPEYIKQGYMPGVYIDHTALGKDCINVNFCGYKVPVIAGIPALCVRKNYPAIFFFTLYDGKKFKIIVKNPVFPDKKLKPKERIIKFIEDINKVYEEVYRQYPEQWYLIHRRFKRVELEDGTLSGYLYDK